MPTCPRSIRTTGCLGLFGLIAALSAHSNAQAQEVQEEVPEEKTTLLLQEIIVVGSHIRGQADSVAYLPETLSTRVLNNAGWRYPNEVAGDLIPAARPGLSADSFLSPGAHFLSPFNLYGLGAGRTLVMLDGQRLGIVPLPLPGWRDAAPSLSDLPPSALSGLQLLPTGTSSLYGSGAVAGALNLVLREPFSGIEYSIHSFAPDESDHQEWQELAFGLSGNGLSFFLALDQQSIPSLSTQAMPWARAFQSENPQYSVMNGNGAPGALEIQGEFADLYRGSPVTPCLPAVVDDSGATTTPAILCDNDEVVFNGLVPLSPLLPAGQNSVNVVDFSCESLGGVPMPEEDQCRYRFGDHLMLRQAQNSERIISSFNYKLSDGAEMRFQYLTHDNSVPSISGVAQRTPTSARLRNWNIPLSNPGLFQGYLSLQTGDGTFYGAVELDELRDTGYGGGLTAPDADFFLTAVGGRATASQPEIDAAEDAAAAVEADNLVLSPTLADLLQTAPTLTYNGNLLGSSGGSPSGSSSYRRQRYAWDMEGQLGVSNVYYRTGVVHDRARTTVRQRDLVIERMERALNGYGGPACDYDFAVANDIARADTDSTNDPSSVSPGAGLSNCFYVAPLGGGLISILNPLSLTNPVLVGSLIGTPLGSSIQDWLFAPHTVSRRHRSLVANFLLESGNEKASWVAGTEIRSENFHLEPMDFANANDFSCDLTGTLPEGASNPFGPGCLDPTGPYATLPSLRPDTKRRDILAGFGELRLTPSEKLSVQLALRYEMHDDDDSAFAPSVAVSWASSPALKLGASIGSSFRFPSLTQQADISADTAYADALKDYLLLYVEPAEETLSAESATNIDLNLRYTQGGLLFWLRYWQIQLSDGIVRDPAPVIAAAYADAFTCEDADGICDSSRALVDAVRERLIAPEATPSADEIRSGLRLGYSNGPDINASGFGLHLGYSLRSGIGDLGLGLDLNYLSEYTVDEFYFNGQSLGPAFDAAGRFNEGYAFGSLPSNRNTLQLQWSHGASQAQLLTHIVSSYRDHRYAVDIDSWQRTDFSYGYTLPSRKIHLEISMTNITNEAPPRALTPLGYDAQQHDPFGRTLRFGVRLKYPE